MGTAVAHRQRRLSAFAAAAALVHFQVVADGIDIHQGIKNISAQHHWPDHFCNFAVADAVGFAGRKSEHFHARLTAVPVFCVDTIFDISNHIFERTSPGFDVSIGHPYNRRVAVIYRPRIAGGFFVHFRSGFAGMQPAGEFAFPD